MPKTVFYIKPKTYFKTKYILIGGGAQALTGGHQR